MDIRHWTHKISGEDADATNIVVTVENNGPALTVEVSAINKDKYCCSKKKNVKRSYFYADFTLGLHCKSWPRKAEGLLLILYLTH